MESLPINNGPKNEEKEELQIAPEGWLTLTGVCKTYWPNRKFNTYRDVSVFDSNRGEYVKESRGRRNDIPYYELKVLISKYKESNPEYFDFYKAGSSKAEHLSPELVKIIADHFGRSISKNQKRD